ncbi:peptide chain release factor N(5)-glutamine methyltransferase [Staphylococcus sp. IVB6181]|uniref:peptide chain release factor N(5)-glutamine methyltransferase n=1 Tax=Staphylococcus sp. IVB6181 TaxID=2929481 RepID=UPI0021CE6EF5|nr:peptide chain release factor N(5)-glutamine methyltransferase [Staphylococcus sp. IVB6181]UXV35776.1 peptide chain release factor N(5)-glutamine methyltransferase [Staphylococcus sp. IVB6181]
MSYKEAVQAAAKQAVARGFESKRAEWLLLDLLDWSLADYVLKMNDTMTKAHRAAYQAAAERMLTGEPIQYITGFQSFYGERFKVDARCLIPRPETEEVLLHFMNQLSNSDSVADIGTGSGIIAVMLKLLKPDLTVYATDLFEGPLEIARANAAMHQTDITFLQGSDLSPLIEQNIRLDGLISNPPYIDQAESIDMAETVVDYEPHQALFAKEHGLAIYRAIIEKLPQVLNDNAVVVFEIGYNQGEVLKALIQSIYPSIEVDVIQDINQNDRIISFIWKR